MQIQKHGLSVGIERVDDNIFLSLKAVGKLTHEDYKTITPLLDSALEHIKHPHVNVFVDATELEGWELRAAWDDLKLGLKHGNAFNKVALFGNRNWQEISAKVGNWFISGEVKFFDNQNEALNWIST